MELIEKILVAIKRNPKDMQTYDDAFACMSGMGEDGLKYNLILRNAIKSEYVKAIKSKDYTTSGGLYDKLRDSYVFSSGYSFEDFIFALEYDRENGRQFYSPRQMRLSVVAEQMQALADGKLDLLCVSLPPGVGKTTLAIFFILWLVGRHPELPILSGSYSTALMRGVYEECHRIATDPEYNFAKIFPNSPVVRTNAQDLALDFKTKNRFSSLQFTSIGSGNAGRLRAMQLLYCDDLVSGIEEAMSKERLDKLWQNYTVDLKQRKMGSCPELHIATRWSVHDVIGRLERDNENNERAKFLVLPALDENEESNFDYKYSVGFSTKNYYDLRDAMDDVSWKALFMNQPIEREGLLYNAEELRRYYKLPQEEPDAIIGLADTKDTGKDYAVLMVAYVYGNDFYIEDIVCTNSTDLYEGFFADILIRNNVHMCRFESNSAGGKIADNVARIIDGKCKTRIDKKYTTGNKETKIVVNAPFVKNNFLFKDRSVIVKKSQYAKFMELFCSYSLMGKNSFDDTVDCAAMLAIYSENIHGRQITTFQRRI